MKIIKRNGAEVPFDITKIITAVTKASDSVGGQSRLTREQITQIAAAVTDQCQALNRAVSVEEVQDLVENQLMDIQAHDVARHYITYRYVQSLKRQTNTTDERILSLIECQNEEVKQENANKNPTVNSVQRDYMAGEISKDLTARLLLDPEIVKAHQEGLIHFHDSDYFAQHMHNCDLVNLDDMLQNGTVISGTYIEKPHSFSTACNIATQITTFFLIGKQIEGNEDLVRRMQAEGHQVGSHTWNHVRLQGISRETLQREVGRTEETLEALLGGGPYWLRPPYGAVDAADRELLQVPMIKWSIDPRDWEKLNTAQVKAAVLENAAPNQIILLHDIYDTSVDAALEIVDTLQGEGYRFVTVQELLEANGIQPEAGVLYCSGDI